jgi:glycosyltransferase involved in cell wall biosynthesis
MTLDTFGISREKTAIIQNVWPRIEASATKERKKIILWAGRMLYLKNLYRLIRAFEKIGNLGYELHLVGDGPERQKLEKFVSENKYGKVVFLPPLDRQALVEKLSSVAFFVLPSISDVGPNVIAEAIGTKTPFIMTKESGYAEYLKDTGLLVDPLDEEDIRKKLETMISERKIYEKKVFAFSVHRGWEHTAAEWIRLFRGIVNTRALGKTSRGMEKVLVVGRDPNLLKTDSAVFNRARDYAGLLREYHIVLAGTEKDSPKSFGNLFLWPTGSSSILFAWFDALRLGRKIIKERQIQLIDAQDTGEAGVAAFLLSRVAGIPFRVQIHTDIFSPYYRRASWKERVRYWLAKFLIPRASCVRVVSARIKSSLFQAKPGTCFRPSLGRVTILPIFTDTAKFFQAGRDPATDERFRNYDFKMMAVGRFVDKEKNFSMLIEMMRKFVGLCPKALLVLVGDGPDKNNYQSAVSSYQLQKNVIIEPWRSDLNSFYKSFDLYLLSSNFEGWGRTVVEAMASGLPVVMTDVGLAGEMAKDGLNARVVPVGDSDRFFKAIRELWQDPTSRRRLARAGRKSAKFSRPATKAEYLALYKESFLKCGF